MAGRVEKKVVFAGVRAEEMEGVAEKKGDLPSGNGRDVGAEENSEKENDCRETTVDQRVDTEAEDRGGEEEEESERAHDHDLERAGRASWVVRAFRRSCLSNSHHHGSATRVSACTCVGGCGRTPCTTPWLTIHQCRAGHSCAGAQTHNCACLRVTLRASCSESDGFDLSR